MWTLRVKRFGTEKFAKARPSDVHYFKALLETLDGIASRSGPEFMADESCVPEVGDCICDEAIIQFLCIVDFLPSRNAGDVDVADQIEIIAEVPHDVSIHYLNVVDVVKDLHARRIHPLAHSETPGKMVEDLIGALVVGNLGVRDFHAKRDVLLLR